MSIEGILTIVSIVFTGIVGYVLMAQIKSQKETINNLEQYIKTIDWKKVKEFYDEFLIPSEKLKAVKPHLNEKEELINYVRFVITPAIKLDVDINKFVENNLPSCKRYFQDLIDLNAQQRNSKQINTSHIQLPDS